MRRKPNPEQRRRELCDVAIRLLAHDGVKGLSHLKVDRTAGLPDGTTSFYFRTRTALVNAAAARVAELDLKDLSSATAGSEQSEVSSPAWGLSNLVIRSASGARLMRTKARNELALQASRDGNLDEALSSYNEEFFALIRDVVIRLQPKGEPDPVLVDEQAYAVMTFISGVMLAFNRGDHRIRTAAELDVLICGIVDGVGTAVRAANTPPAAKLRRPAPRS
ncbi:TetR/AcrR family transcriptional regulator [Mycobacterium sp. RTGN5]|uniref:TetR/AcrR family transcriptional regulator n=1 Tax=Mycobacterium sp. RTGN5 TaxID=3016522 RepID=UPI0029C7996C|nr:TetR/AcrR family transcriptional regulator [Mycobacterium sp. RTGN5]